jgi:hypothetical protein
MSKSFNAALDRQNKDRDGDVSSSSGGGLRKDEVASNIRAGIDRLKAGFAGVQKKVDSKIGDMQEFGQAHPEVVNGKKPAIDKNNLPPELSKLLKGMKPKADKAPGRQADKPSPPGGKDAETSDGPEVGQRKVSESEARRGRSEKRREEHADEEAGRFNRWRERKQKRRERRKQDRQRQHREGGGHQGSPPDWARSGAAEASKQSPEFAKRVEEIKRGVDSQKGKPQKIQRGPKDAGGETHQEL